MSLFVRSVPCHLTRLLLACLSYQATGTDQVCCTFLGKHPIEGVGPASRQVQAVPVCTRLQGPGIANPNTLLCVYVLPEGIVHHEQGAQGSQLFPFPHKMQNFLLSARYTQSCALTQVHGHHHLLPDGRKQACRRWEALFL